MAKKHFKYSVTLLIIVASLIAGTAMGIFHYLYNPAVSESAAAYPVPQILEFRFSQSADGLRKFIRYEAFNSNYTIVCNGWGTPYTGLWSGKIGGVGALRPKGSVEITPLKGNYTFKFECVNQAGQSSGVRTISAYLTGGGGGGGCLVADTKISMADGSSKNIQDVRAGDSVLSSKGPAKVSKTFVHAVNPEPVYLVNGSLAATANHPVYANGKFVRVDELKVGDQLSGGQAVTSLEKTDRSETVYNLEVDGSHDYYANGILVHNKMNY